MARRWHTYGRKVVDGKIGICVKTVFFNKINGAGSILGNQTEIVWRDSMSKAGEAGAGFAVVADEVRNLALRAADAAKDTAALIEGTVKKVKGGSDLLTRTNEAFTEVAASSTKVGRIVTEIAAASSEQALGIEQVNNAVSDMDKVVQESAASAEESASAAEEMYSQAEQMKGVIEELAGLVGGAGNHGKEKGADSDNTGQENDHLMEEVGDTF